MNRAFDSAKYTPEQLRTLRHMLGIDDPYIAKPKPYRDYYCANPNDPKLLELVAIGAVTCYARRGGYDWFRCTREGRAAAIASQRAIRVPKSKRIYAKFLDVRECFPDLTFRQFLTDGQFYETRRAA